ncbi:B3/B4 domain-containing protein [Arthrobacter sp. HLT1-21]
MNRRTALQHLVDSSRVDTEVFELRPDYRAMIIAVDGLVPGPSDQGSEALLQAAEASARRLLDETRVEQLPHVAAWRDAYRSFGAKPQRTRNSLEGLVRRAVVGLPRVNRLTDLYNAISVLHQVPLGGEDLAGYIGAPRLIRATGDELFDTATGGTETVEHPQPGEVVWCDDAGVTCRRWNWRQGRRTQLSDDTTTALFIVDALGPMTDDALQRAVHALGSHLEQLGPDVQLASHLVRAEPGKP